MLEHINVLVVGMESVGKSALVSTLTQKYAESANFGGTTLRCEKYLVDDFAFYDTPGISLQSDAISMQETFRELRKSNIILMVVHGKKIDDDIKSLLPLLRRKRGIIVVTFRDSIELEDRYLEKINELEEKLPDISIIPVNATQISPKEKNKIFSSLKLSRYFPERTPEFCVDFNFKEIKTIFDLRFLGFILSTLMIFLPSFVAVTSANKLADNYYDGVVNFINPLIKIVENLPEPLNFLLAKDYGIFSMLPFLILYALPTVIIFSFLIGLYKSSGLINKISQSIQPAMASFGINGHDVLRIVMGFGCNVPAIASCRTCSLSTRNSAIKGICMGSACSYQLPAVIAVFAAIDKPNLIIVYLILLVTSTLLYLKLTTPKRFKKHNLLINKENPSMLVQPSFKYAFKEVNQNIKMFVLEAFPVFIVICLIASTLKWLGLFEVLNSLFSPLMAIFNLPSETSMAVILASIRKDGLFVLLAENSVLKQLNVVQTMTIVYLASVLLPCLVTLIAVVKEVSIKFAIKLALYQAGFTVVFSLIIAWVGNLLIT